MNYHEHKNDAYLKIKLKDTKTHNLRKLHYMKILDVLNKSVDFKCVVSHIYAGASKSFTKSEKNDSIGLTKMYV